AEWGVRSLGAVPLGVGAGNLDAEDSARIMLSALAEHRGVSALPEEMVVLAGSEYEAEAFLGEARRRFSSEEGASP
ncbi:MAG: hypothetical protein ACOCUZ_02610, partial [bacterium]